MEKQTIQGKLLIDSLSSQLKFNDNTVHRNFLKDLEKKLINSYEYKENLNSLTNEEKIRFSELLYKIALKCNYKLHKSIYEMVDPIYANLNWRGTKIGSSSYIKDKLNVESPIRIAIKPELEIDKSLIFNKFHYIAIALLIMKGFYNYSIYALVYLFIITFFTAIIIWKIYKINNIKIIDKSLGYLHINGENKIIVMIKDIRAIQINKIHHCIKEVRKGTVGFTEGRNSYELNIVLNSGKQINIMDNPNGKYIDNNAIVISKFLNKPIWT